MTFHVEKHVVEKRITFLTTNGTLENKPNGNKNSFRVKNKAKLASDDIIDHALAPTKIFNTSTETQVTYSLWWQCNWKQQQELYTTFTREHDFRDLTTSSNRFVLEQLNVVKKSLENLKNQPQAQEPTSGSRRFTLVSIFKGEDSLSKNRK